MVLTKSELIGALQHEVHVLVHLAGKVEPQMIDYRPTPQQRSTLELLRYLTVMGPALIEAARDGGFDPARWNAREQPANARGFDETVKALAGLQDAYDTLLGDLSEEDFRREIEMWGRRTTIGSFVVTMVLNGHAAYRTQLFLYLKSCGRQELGTMNLWAGTDAPAPAATT
jgi:hypothetical protein